MKTRLSGIVYILIAALFASAGQIMFKFASNYFTDLHSFVFNPFLYCGLAAYGIGLVLTLKAYRRGDLTILYPMYATSFIWVCIASPLVFGSDSMSIQKWIGIVTIILGIALIAKGGRK